MPGAGQRRIWLGLLLGAAAAPAAWAADKWNTPAAPPANLAPADDAVNAPLLDEDLYLKMLREELEGAGDRDAGDSSTYAPGGKSGKDSGYGGVKSRKKTYSPAENEGPGARGDKVFKGFRPCSDDQSCASLPPAAAVPETLPSGNSDLSLSGDDDLFLSPAQANGESDAALPILETGTPAASAVPVPPADIGPVPASTPVPAATPAAAIEQGQPAGPRAAPPTAPQAGGWRSQKIKMVIGGFLGLLVIWALVQTWRTPKNKDRR